MAKKLPYVIYVKRIEDGDAVYLRAEEDVDQLAEMGESIPVGTYRLETTRPLTCQPRLEK